ncbi:hypothetical protein QOZ80_1AG0004100 [Eleusine coracana subsp. coracana]|nr:hypothetical protein QOZ80_1AG0004100 [Eleusine coracana subsp. coracana]
MTQKQSLFKGKSKKKVIPPSRHGKAPHIRKGKRVVKPKKFTEELDAEKELTKFINHCNEIKAANIASKEGGDLNIVKPDGDQSKSNQ